MTNAVHVLSVASLLLVAFLVGAVIGTVARFVWLRLGRKPEVAAPAPAADATAIAPLVAAPVIAPLPVAPVPVTPPLAEIPVPDFAATLIALANETPPAAFLEAAKSRTTRVVASTAEEPPQPPAAIMQPAHAAGETTSGLHVAAPRHDDRPPAGNPAQPAEQRTAEVIRFPSAAAEVPATQPRANIVVGGETVVVVDASDLASTEKLVEEATPADPSTPSGPKVELAPAGPTHQEDRFHFVAPGDKSAPAISAPRRSERADTTPVPPIAANAAVGDVLPGVLSSPQVFEPASVSGKAAPDPIPEAEIVEAPAASRPPTVADHSGERLEAATMAEAEPEPALEQQGGNLAAPDHTPQEPQDAPSPPEASAPPEESVDEDAAMRAIEGSWSPRSRPARPPVAPKSAPEGVNQAVAASARAVSAARRTAEGVVAEVAEMRAEAGRPSALDAPRDGRKDDLTHIIGVLPVIETALNKLGIYHFDQVGALTDQNIAWIEAHLGIPGRIARELWREQARELSAVLKPRRAAEH